MFLLSIGLKRNFYYKKRNYKKRGKSITFATSKSHPSIYIIHIQMFADAKIITINFSFV